MHKAPPTACTVNRCMLKYIFKRACWGLLVMLGVVHVIFFMFHALPGNPADLLAGPRADREKREQISRELKLNEPLPRQLQGYLNDLSPVSLHRDTPRNQKKYNYLPLLKTGQRVLVLKVPYLRRSFQTNRSVASLVAEYFAGSFWLAVPALLLATLAGSLAGIVAALYRGSLADRIIFSVSVAGISTPSFVLAVLMAIVFGYYLSDLTHLNLTGSLWENAADGSRYLVLKNLLLPAFTLAIRPAAVIAQLMRNSMLEVLAQEYVLAARAKGLGRLQIVWRHVLRNAISPLVTSISGWLATLIASTFFVEYIFSWKGLGLRTIQAVESMDLPVIMGAALAFSAFFILVNILADILHALVNPQARFV